MNLNWGLVSGDICEVQCDAIVNAANTTLLGGGGVDGAIHDAAGPELNRFIRNNLPVLGEDRIDPTAKVRCQYGMAIATPSFKMKNCKAIIHTVGPIWMGGGRREVGTLMKCYLNCLDTAFVHGFKSVAFPSISTGCFHFPLSLAVEMATHAVKRWLVEYDNAVRVVFVAHDDETYNEYDCMMKFRARKGGRENELKK